MNVYDSGRMADVLAPLGYVPAEAVEDADIVILNTCHIREKAVEKVYSELGRLRRHKEQRRAAGGDLIIALAGCVAQAEGAEIRRRAPVVDIVVGPQSYHSLPGLIEAVRSGGDALDTEFPAQPKFDHLPAREPGLGTAPSAFLTVQEGCDKFCTFCVVPYTRGAEYSRPAADVLHEARQLVAGGALEITVLGQNVNAYHGPGEGGEHRSLAQLLASLAAIEGLERLRYTTSHPLDMDEALISAHRDLPELMPYLHLPVQSGSDRVLAAMNRRHTADDYRRVVERVRAARPDIAVSGDFIVGFPGEQERDFEDTLNLAADIGYAQAYSFKYSARPGTPAAERPDQVPQAVARERLARLREVLDRQQRAFNQATVGRELPVLLEREGKHPGQLVGRSPYMQAVQVQVSGPQHLGRLVTVRIEAGHANSLDGALIEPLEGHAGAGESGAVMPVMPVMTRGRSREMGMPG